KQEEPSAPNGDKLFAGAYGNRKIFRRNGRLVFQQWIPLHGGHRFSLLSLLEDSSTLHRQILQKGNPTRWKPGSLPVPPVRAGNSDRHQTDSSGCQFLSVVFFRHAAPVVQAKA